MLAAIISAIGLPVLVKLLRLVLDKINSPIAKSASAALGEVEEYLSKGGITDAELSAANFQLAKEVELEISNKNIALEEVNKSIRAEIKSGDKFVRRMRPTFGYLMAFTWAAQMFGVAYVIVFDTVNAPYVLNAMASLGTIWGIGLSVLGIYVYKRSEEKKQLSNDQEKIYWKGERKG